jgi:hypothetical protein
LADDAGKAIDGDANMLSGDDYMEVPRAKDDEANLSAHDEKVPGASEGARLSPHEEKVLVADGKEEQSGLEDRHKKAPDSEGERGAVDGDENGDEKAAARDVEGEVAAHRAEEEEGEATLVHDGNEDENHSLPPDAIAGDVVAAGNKEEEEEEVEGWPDSRAGAMDAFEDLLDDTFEGAFDEEGQADKAEAEESGQRQKEEAPAKLDTEPSGAEVSGQVVDEESAEESSEASADKQPGEASAHEQSEEMPREHQPDDVYWDEQPGEVSADERPDGVSAEQPGEVPVEQPGDEQLEAAVEEEGEAGGDEPPELVDVLQGALTGEIAEALSVGRGEEQREQNPEVNEDVALGDGIDNGMGGSSATSAPESEPAAEGDDLAASLSGGEVDMPRPADRDRETQKLPARKIGQGEEEPSPELEAGHGGRLEEDGQPGALGDIIRSALGGGLTSAADDTEPADRGEPPAERSGLAVLLNGFLDEPEQSLTPKPRAANSEAAQDRGVDEHEQPLSLGDIIGSMPSAPNERELSVSPAGAGHREWVGPGIAPTEWQEPQPYEPEHIAGLGDVIGHSLVMPEADDGNGAVERSRSPCESVEQDGLAGLPSGFDRTAREATDPGTLPKGSAVARQGEQSQPYDAVTDAWEGVEKDDVIEGALGTTSAVSELADDKERPDKSELAVLSRGFLETAVGDKVTDQPLDALEPAGEDEDYEEWIPTAAETESGEAIGDRISLCSPSDRRSVSEGLFAPLCLPFVSKPLPTYFFPHTPLPLNTSKNLLHITPTPSCLQTTTPLFPHQPSHSPTP